jgi:hypothetical protein
MALLTVQQFRQVGLALDEPSGSASADRAECAGQEISDREACDAELDAKCQGECAHSDLPAAAAADIPRTTDAGSRRGTRRAATSAATRAGLRWACAPAAHVASSARECAGADAESAGAELRVVDAQGAE